MGNTEKTLEYYNQQASNFVIRTVNVRFSNLQDKFTAYLHNGASILDFGCGSGRDSKAFKNKGFAVTAVDGSEELCKIASEYADIRVICSTFQKFEIDQKFDGIWACASLLHLEIKDIKSVMKKLSSYLNERGCFYISFKYGTYMGERNGRFFTDMTEVSIRKILKEIPDLIINQIFITEDIRPNREEKWLNVFLLKKPFLKMRYFLDCYTNINNYFGLRNKCQALVYRKGIFEDENTYTFLHGTSNLFALALQERFGYNVLKLQTENNDKAHYFCQTCRKGEMFYIDVRGITMSLEDIIYEFVPLLDYKFNIVPYNIDNKEDNYKLDYARLLIGKNYELYHLK